MAHTGKNTKNNTKETSKAHTRATKQKAEQMKLKSPILDHCKRENHINGYRIAGGQETGPEDSKRDLLFYEERI